MSPRAATPADFGDLAIIWHDGWHDGHAQIVSAQMRAARTMQNFRERVADAYRDMRIVGEVGTPVGFHIVKQDELAHLYVSRNARGSGVAAQLLGDAERQIAAAGHQTAWLSCAVGNDRAGRFYEKHGWARTATTIIRIDLPSGTVPLDVWRYEKPLRATRS